MNWWMFIVKIPLVLPFYVYPNDCISFNLRLGVLGVICKVDMEKAYDHKSRGFLDYVLGRPGFGVKWGVG